MTTITTEAITPETHLSLYIAGPMTGLPSWNYPAFHAAALRLRDAGYHVLNPAENFGGSTTLRYEAYVRHALRDVTKVDAVACLPGWEHSKGAGMETAVAGWIGVPLVCAETLLPVSREQPKPVKPYHRIAFAGFARSGKDEAAKALLACGFHRHNFGDIIKARLQRAPVYELATVLIWVQANEPCNEAVIYDCVTGFMRVYSGDIATTTEGNVEKAQIRTILERYGEAFYDDILAEYMALLPEKCVNTRLVRCKEAAEWTAAGGIIILIDNPLVVPASPWELDRLNELEEAGFIHATIVNDGTVDALHDAVRHIAAGHVTLTKG